jgi:hypothetical protein
MKYNLKGSFKQIFNQPAFRGFLLCLTRSKPMAGAKSVHKLGVALELIIGYGDTKNGGYL